MEPPPVPRRGMYMDPAQIPMTLMEPAMDAGQPVPGCPYCRGVRSQCTCTVDCGTRAQHPLEHVCQKAPADVRAEAMRRSGLYSEEEIARFTS